MVMDTSNLRLSADAVSGMFQPISKVLSDEESAFKPSVSGLNGWGSLSTLTSAIYH